MARGLAEIIRRGVSPAMIADRAFRAVREDRFYVLSDDDWRDLALLRMDDIRDGLNPTFRAPGL